MRTIKRTDTPRMMKMKWMTRMINGTLFDEEYEYNEYVDDKLSMTKKMTNRTCESSD